MKVLLDTNICIYLIKNNPPQVRQHFAGLQPGDIGVSAITVAELQYGVAKSSAREKNAAALGTFLLPLEILPFDGKSAAVYGTIRAHMEQQGRPIDNLDVLIAAQAIAYKLTLVSDNLKEFERVPDLLCANWVH